MRCLVADIGGTNMRLAIYADATCIARVDARTLDGVRGPIAALLQANPGVERICLAVAGPVQAGRATLTNVGATIDAAELSASLGVGVRVINDFHAQALAAAALGPDDMHALPGRAGVAVDPTACRVVIGAGTGLGEAVLVPCADGSTAVIAGEGGHKRFAPRDAEALGLRAALSARFGSHVSVERVVSGPGIAATHRYLSGGDGPDVDPAWITAEALRGGAPAAVKAVTVFIDALADEAANLALQCNAGAVYIGGGIAPRILPLLAPRFRAAFEDKGRLGAQLQGVPVFVITHPDPGLLGARLAAIAD